MKQIKKAKKITALDIAKLVGNEKEYKDALFEQELKRNYDIIMEDVVDKNNTIDIDE